MYGTVLLLYIVSFFSLKENLYAILLSRHEKKYSLHIIRDSIVSKYCRYMVSATNRFPILLFPNFSYSYLIPYNEGLFPRDPQ